MEVAFDSEDVDLDVLVSEGCWSGFSVICCCCATPLALGSLSSMVPAFAGEIVGDRIGRF